MWSFITQWGLADMAVDFTNALWLLKAGLVGLVTLAAALLSKIQKVLSCPRYVVSQKSPERTPAFRSRSGGVMWRIS